MAEQIEVLTFCHNCEKVFNDKHIECPACGSSSVLMCAPGASIREWVKIEKQAEQARCNHCGCCDEIFV